MRSSFFNSIIQLIKQEVVPATGCTEPIAVALAAAKAKSLLQEIPETVSLKVSGNILKNGMGVCIPGTKMTGLPIAAALGAVCGDAEALLNVLHAVDEKAITQGKGMIQHKQINIELAEDAPDKLFIACTAKTKSHTAHVVIMHKHTEFVLLQLDEAILLDKRNEQQKNKQQLTVEDLNLTLDKVYDFAQNVPLEDIRFIEEAANLNEHISQEGMTGDWGLKVGKTIHQHTEDNLFGTSLLCEVVARTVAASDARMAGCLAPVMTNSGSGNQGITVTLPILTVARHKEASQEQLLRALTLGHLTSIYIHSYIGHLSALCGVLIAAMGAASGMCYLLNEDLAKIKLALQNMAGNITGMICDGAKTGCALKVSSGVTAAMQACVLAQEDICIQRDGIVDPDVEKTLRNIGILANEGMSMTDATILQTMLSKQFS